MSKLSADVPVRIAIVGCGHVLPIYIKTLTHFNHVRVTACTDMVAERAQAAAAAANAQACSLDEILNSDEIDLVVNLTPVTAHHPVSCAVLRAGKHLYSEKPLASTTSQLHELEELAAERSLEIGSAPDTFLGAGLQTVEQLIKSKVIGEPVGFHFRLLSRGCEAWHPNPDFMYAPGGGPLMDSGPYALSALCRLFGKVKAVTARAHTAHAYRTIQSGPRQGQQIAVTTPTHITALFEMASGIHGSIIFSFDTPTPDGCPVEIYGTEGTLRCASPTGFGGPVLTSNGNGWQEHTLVNDFTENSRGLGLAHFARCLQTGQAADTGLPQVKHVLNVLFAACNSIETGSRITEIPS